MRIRLEHYYDCDSGKYLYLMNEKCRSFKDTNPGYSVLRFFQLLSIELPWSCIFILNAFRFYTYVVRIVGI